MRGRTRYTVAFYRHGRRERRTFGSLDRAKSEARSIARQIQNGLQESTDLRPHDRENYLAATRLLESLGVPLVDRGLSKPMAIAL